MVDPKNKGINIHYSKEDIVDSVSDNIKPLITQNIVDLINTSTNDPEELVNIRSTFVTYSSVLNEGKFKIVEYLNASKFVSYKLLGYNNTKAYIKTFPKRYERMVAQGKSTKAIYAFVQAYKSSKLVTSISAQVIVPAYIQYKDVFDAAIRKNYELMMNEQVSHMVQQKAASDLMKELKMPEEVKKVDMSIQVNTQHNYMGNLLEKLSEVASKIQDTNLSTKEILDKGITIDEQN